MAVALVAIGVVIGVINQIKYVSFYEEDDSFRKFTQYYGDRISQAKEIFASRSLLSQEKLYLSWIFEGKVMTCAPLPLSTNLFLATAPHLCRELVERNDSGITKDYRFIQ